jgi:ech hydrogenase subunit A
MVVGDMLLAAVFIYIGWRVRSPLVMSVATANLVLALLLDKWTGFHEAEPVLLIAHLALIMVLITCLVGSVIAIYSLRYMVEDPHRPRVFAAVLLFLGAMNGATLSNDMLWLFVFWDLTTLCSFLLIGHTGTEEAKRAARWALQVTLTGGLAFILAAVLAFHFLGSISLKDIPMDGLDGMALLPLALLVVAAFTKSAQVPFQSWLLGAMVAPPPVSARLHTATLVHLGGFLLLRLSPVLTSIPPLSALMALVGGASFIASCVLAITQSNAKRVLAWSTIGNLGLITMCVGISTPLAVTAAMVLLLYHAISKALMFLAVGVVKEEVGSEDIEDMHGARVTMPYATLAISVGIFTIILPPFGMFASKWLISEAALTYPFLIFLLALGFAGMTVYYFKWLGAILSTSPGARPVPLTYDPLPRNYRWTLGALMVGAVGLSALIGPTLRHLILPFMEGNYLLPVSTDDLSLFTSSGEFPVFLFLLFAALISVGLGLLVRPDAEKVSIPYACGETFEFESRGNYYLDAEKVRLGITVTEGAGMLLVVLVLVVPMLLEVL